VMVVVVVVERGKSVNGRGAGERGRRWS